MLGFAAVNTGNNLMFLIVSGLLAFMSITGLAGMVNIKGLTPQLQPPAEIFAGTPVLFRLRVANSKRHIPSFLIRIECSGGDSVVLPVITSGSSSEDVITLQFPERGRVVIGTITLSSPFPVNFFRRYLTFDDGSEVIVYPSLKPGINSSEGNDDKNQGTAAVKERGHDGELEKISGYSGREPLRVIHWKLSARSGDLLVKEFGRHSVTPLVIDLDSLAGSSLEERLSRAAWLIRRWVVQRPVGLRLGGRIIPPGTGHRHGAVMLTELALYGLD